MENQEEVHEILTAFEKKPSKDIPPLLEDYLRSVAKTGKIVFPWSRVKPLFVSKLEQVMEHFNKDVPYDHLAPYPNVEQVKYEEMRSRILEAVHRFTGAPFTIQRICELVTQSKAHYTRCDKFLRGIEKNVMVVSTVDPCGRWVSSGAMTPKVDPQRVMMNGLDVNGVCQQQRADPNDINEGQPFGGLPHPDWSNNNSAAVSVWPSQGVVDEMATSGPGSLYLGPPVSQNGTSTGQLDPALGKPLDTAAQDSVQVSSAVETITATSQVVESFPSSDHVVSDSCAPSSSSSSSSSSESLSPSPPLDTTASFSFVTKSSTEQGNVLTDTKVQEADNEPESSRSADNVAAPESQETETPAEKSEAVANSKPSEVELEPGEVVKTVEATPEPVNESQEAEGSAKHSADDSEDAPPEKRLKAETEGTVEDDQKVETVDTTCTGQSSEAQVTDSTTESAAPESLLSSEETCNKQTEGDQSDKISQSENVTSESEPADTNQSDITSTDDAQQQEVTQENIDQSETGSVSVDQSQEACVSQSDTVEEKQSESEAVPETSEVTPPNDQEGSDSAMEGGDKPSDCAESSECNSTTEMMETDSGSEETKPEGPAASSAPDESEPMDQE